MPFNTLSLGLTLTIPTNGTRNWGSTMFSTTWTKISGHGHTGSGDGKKIGPTALEDAAVTTAKLSNNIGFKQNASTLTPTGTAQTINFNDGMIQKMTLASATGDVVLTLSNPTQGSYYKLFVTQGATPRSLIWPATVRWPQGQAAILSTASGAIDILNMYYDGTNYFIDWDLQYS